MARMQSFFSRVAQRIGRCSIQRRPASGTSKAAPSPAHPRENVSTAFRPSKIIGSIGGTIIPTRPSTSTNAFYLPMTETELLQAFDESVREIGNFDGLDLTNRGISSLPELPATFADLQQLSLKKNQLTSLPETIPRLTNLETPSLSQNPFL